MCIPQPSCEHAHHVRAQGQKHHTSLLLNRLSNGIALLKTGMTILYSIAVVKLPWTASTDLKVSAVPLTQLACLTSTGCQPALHYYTDFQLFAGNQNVPGEHLQRAVIKMYFNRVCGSQYVYNHLPQKLNRLRGSQNVYNISFNRYSGSRNGLVQSFKTSLQNLHMRSPQYSK